MTLANPEDLDRVIVVKAPNYAKMPLVIKKKSLYYKKGQIPSALKSHVFQKNGVPKLCSESTKSLPTGERRKAFLNCIAEKTKK